LTNYVLNNIPTIANHFNVSQQHVIDVFLQSQSYQGQMWTQFFVAWIILTLVVTCVIYYFKHDGYGGAFESILLGLGVFGFCGGLFASCIFASLITASPQMVEFNMYYDWIRGVVGAL